MGLRKDGAMSKKKPEIRAAIGRHPDTDRIEVTTYTLKDLFRFSPFTMFDAGPHPRAQYRELLDLMEAYGLKGSATVGAIVRCGEGVLDVWTLAPSEVDRWIDRLTGNQQIVGFIVPKRPAREELARHMDRLGELATYAPFEFWMLTCIHRRANRAYPGFDLSLEEAHSLFCMSSEVLNSYGFLGM